MTEEIIDASTQSCKCDDGECAHQEMAKDGMWTKPRGSEELALAFLLALTPLTVLSFFGQAGLL
jgi:hypothetical protein